MDCTQSSGDCAQYSVGLCTKKLKAVNDNLALLSISSCNKFDSYGFNKSGSNT